MTPDEDKFAETLLKDEHGRIVYTYRGPIEKGVGGRYVWRNGYSATTKNGGVLYPWMEKIACRRDANRYRRQAAFVETKTTGTNA